MFDRPVYNGEIGWATAKAMHISCLCADDFPGRGPNYGQIFEDHAEVYSWLSAP